jgi:hypothetical protein
MDNEHNRSVRTDVHYDPDAGLWKAPHEGFVSDESIDIDRGTVPSYALPFAFFFTPSRFMRSYGVHLSGSGLFLVIWITGISLMLLGYEQKISFGTSSLWFPETWAELAGAAGFGGLIRGVVVYWLGGLWYRLRLAMCGVGDASWKRTGRVYMSAGIAKHLLSILAVVIGVTQHDSYIDYVQNESVTLTLIAGGLLVLLEIWSSVTLYAGSRGVFGARKAGAILWFLVLPIMVRLGGLATLLGIIFFLSNASEPQLNQPTKYFGESFAFEYPSNWYITRDQEVPGPESWVQIEPFVGDAFFKITLRNIAPDEDMIADYRQSYELDAGIKFSGTPRSIETQGGFEGYGFEYQGELENKDFILLLFEVEIEDGTRMLINALVEEKSWDTLKPGYDWITDTLRVTKPSEIEPDLRSTYTVAKQPVEFEIPRNWWVDVAEGDELTNTGDMLAPAPFSILVQTPGWGYFKVMIYESDLSARAKLEITIDEYTDDPRLIDEQPIEEWMGIQGFGVTGKIKYADNTLGSAKFLISTLPGGRFLEIQYAVPDEVVDFYDPGFKLIESSFKLLVDPAEREP